MAEKNHAESKEIMPVIADEKEIKSLIYIVRGQQVMLDSDLAMLYKVETGALNRAAKRNSVYYFGRKDCLSCGCILKGCGKEMPGYIIENYE